MAFFGKLIVLVLIHNIGGLLGAELRSSIIGGHNAEDHKWPSMVHLNISDGENNWRCGGTLLNNRWVLTAASCWRNRMDLWERSMAWVGAHSLATTTYKTTKFRGIARVQPHHQYRNLSVGYMNNIAVVELETEVKYTAEIQNVSLPSANDVFGPSSVCKIIGWGNTKPNVPLKYPEILQELQIPIVSHSVCEQEYPGLDADLLCAGDLVKGEKDACEGDFGGPLMCLVDGRYVQAGIMSYGSPKGCGVAGGLGVYTPVAKYLRFIKDFTHQGEEDSAEL